MTMNTCTGYDDDALRLEARTDGSVVNMKGAAIAHVAILFGVPCVEIRGIGNRAGNRDRAAWRIKEAAEAAHTDAAGLDERGQSSTRGLMAAAARENDAKC